MPLCLYAGMLLGVPRQQETAPQIRALKDAGGEKLFEEAASGERWDRPALAMIGALS